MPQFRVGDRVRRISDRGGLNEIEVGDVVVVRAIEQVEGHGQFIKFEGFNGALMSHRFELVTVVQRPGTVFYSVVYRPDPAGILLMRGFETEASFNEFVRTALRYNYIIVAKKKLTLTIPNQEA